MELRCGDGPDFLKASFAELGLPHRPLSVRIVILSLVTPRITPLTIALALPSRVDTQETRRKTKNARKGPAGEDEES